MRHPSGKTWSPQKPSPFAIILARLLDETNYFHTRAEWARFLGVSTSALSQWVNDKTLPRPSMVRMIVDALRSAKGVASTIVNEFDELANRPSEEISPFGARMGATLHTYLETATFAGFGRALRDLPPDDQRLALTQGSFRKATSIHAGTPPADEEFGDTHEPADVDMLLVPDLLQQMTHESSLRVELSSLLSRSRVLVTGAAGSGKSSMLHALARMLREKGTQPTLLRCGARYGSIAREPLGTLRAPTDTGTSLLIDGLDEVTEERRLEAVDEILAVAEASPTLPIFIASRPIPELQHFKAFDRLNVAPLRDVQVVQRVAKALAATGTSQGPSSNELNRFVCHMVERPSLRYCLRNPLFLESACNLLVRNRVTPFSEAELLGEFVWRLLGDWDRDKKVVRIREPWASPRTLWATLAELCFHLVSTRTEVFVASDAGGLMKGRTAKVPYERLLSLLSVQSGLLQADSDNRWHVVTEYLRNFLAAAYVIESSDDALPYLKNVDVHEGLHDVYRLACGITADATPLLRGVLEAWNKSPAERSVLLAETLAQPFIAEGRIVAETCRATVSWLDANLVGWQVYPRPARRRAGDEDTLWHLRARSSQHKSADSNLLRVLGAIHQARSGPARDPFQESLREAKSPVLVAFGASLGVEGRLKLKVDDREDSTMLSARVVTPQLS